MLFDIFFARCSPRFPRALPLRCAALLLQRPSFSCLARARFAAAGSSPQRSVTNRHGFLSYPHSVFPLLLSFSLCSVYVSSLPSLPFSRALLIRFFFAIFFCAFLFSLFLCCDCINTVAKYRRRHSSPQHAHVIQQLDLPDAAAVSQFESISGQNNKKTTQRKGSHSPLTMMRRKKKKNNAEKLRQS